jgi:ribosomal protein L11 methyltransferase
MKERLKEQQHYRVTFKEELKELGELTDALIEHGALEVSYLPSEPLSFSLTLPVSVEEPIAVEAIMALSWGMIQEQQQQKESSGSSALPKWEYEEEIVPNAVNWFKAEADPGFDPVIVGRFQVVPVQAYHDPPPPSAQPQEQQQQLCILPGEGWGTGQHPTTRLCLDFLSQEGVICGGERVIDYGCGSGILSIAAVQVGAREAVGIDVCYDALASAKTNVLLNGVDQEVELIHPREVVPGEFVPGDVVIANILVGTLLAMSNTILGAVKPGGWLVLSGLRPEQVEVIKRKYGGNVVWEEGLERAEEVRNPTFGTGAGFWVRLVGRRVVGARWVETLSEAAVS